MSASPAPVESQWSTAPVTSQWSTAPVIDYEPAPQPLGAHRLSCTTASTHRLPNRRRVQPVEPRPPKSAVVFAETALRQLIEVIDRRRPVAQLNALMAPVLVDQVIARAGVTPPGSATLRRVRVRCVDTGDTEVTAAEVFATFLRCGRVHAVAGRIEPHRSSWRFCALQIG